MLAIIVLSVKDDLVQSSGKLAIAAPIVCKNASRETTRIKQIRQVCFMLQETDSPGGMTTLSDQLHILFSFSYAFLDICLE